MTQVAQPDTVLGSFDGSVIHSDRLAYQVIRQNNEFWAEMPDPDVLMYIVQGGKKLSLDQVPRRKQRVVLTTGSHHYQTYWVNSPRYPGLLQTLPLVYLLQDQRWVPREQAFMRGHNDTERFITQWNHHCIRCHSTGGNPGLNPQTGMLETKVAEYGIACESCHGPGAAHLDFRRRPSPTSPTADPPTPDPIVNPQHLDHRRSSQVCGQCHGVYVMRDEFAMDYAYSGPLYHPGDDLHRTRYYIQYPSPQDPPERHADLRGNPRFFQERWWSDGQILAGGREYTALAASPCYTRGQVSCLSCHSMHRSDPSDQLKPVQHENTRCTQCHHEDRFTDNLSNHTFHRPNSTGSECLNCHMPHTTYALLKGIRSHQISSPNLRGSVSDGSPNACNLCHLDQTLAWTQEHLKARYDIPPLLLTDDQTHRSAALLWLLKGHAAQRVIAAWHFGWAPAQETSGNQWLAPFLAPLLQDPYGVVRYVAARSLRSLPDFTDFDYDFLAPEESLRASARAARQRWKPLPASSTNSAAPNDLQRLLINERGEVTEADLLRLLSQRDDRPVTIKE